MGPTTDLTDEQRLEQDLLKMLYRAGITRGVELNAGLQLEPNIFHRTVKRLADAGVIAYSGGEPREPNDALRTFYSIRPSASGYVRSILK